jgi:hypothetical protein
MRLIRRDIARDASRSEIWVRRWGLFLTLFIAEATIVIDLIVLITTFLQGEDLGARFLLKVLIVLLVAGAGFLHFISDLWGYWERNPRYARMVSWAVAALVALTILSGFLIIGSPQSQRAYRIDEQRVSDLQSIQSQITYFYQQKRLLPTSLSQLQDPVLGFSIPTDPQTQAAYEYEKTADLAFRLCATFSAQSYDQYGSPQPVAPRIYGNVQDNWQHAAGRVCFERMLDPDFYPPGNAKPASAY